ncbi:MAG TPA: GNAT family N-acetyltransferase [Actinomycetota bacterium]|nr:GNAT family N-acetyltransferase [Actinomycetota bacterium]
MSDVLLRGVREDDLPIFFHHQLDPEANQMAAFTARDWDAFTAHWTKILSDETVTKKTILVGGEVAGNIVSWERSGERLVGYWIGRNHWGKGVATKALSQFLGHVAARPLYARVAKHNIASIRVLEKCGFTISGEDTASSNAPGGKVEEFIFELRADDEDEPR